MNNKDITIIRQSGRVGIDKDDCIYFGFVRIFKYTINFGKPYIPCEGDGCCIFNGTIKNKSELKRILQQVGCVQS